MADRFKPLPIFPTLVHGFHLPNFKTDKDKFVKYIEEQRVKDPAGVQISNGGGWQSQATQSGQRSKLTTTLKKPILNYFDDPEIFNKSGKVIVECDKAYFRPLEVDTLLGDARKARKELKWKPKITFEKGIAKTVSHYKYKYDTEFEDL